MKKILKLSQNRTHGSNKTKEWNKKQTKRKSLLLQENRWILQEKI